MKISFGAVFVLIFCIGCSATRSTHIDSPGPLHVAGVSSDPEYGYTKENPIKVGGARHDRGPLNERTYLQNLLSSNGEEVSFRRLGSCCHFETPNSPFGGGLLDMYEVVRAGLQDTVVLYINMYDADTVWSPIGFKFK